MKIQPFKRLNRDDYRNAPDWFYDFLDAMNPLIDTLNILLLSNIDINNNLLAERQVVSLQHNVPITIKLLSLKQQPSLVRVGYANGFIGTGAITGYNVDGTYQVTVFFLGTPPTASTLTVLVFEP